MNGIYLIWGLLPIALIIMTIRAAIRRSINALGKEYPAEYLQQAIFCLVGLAIAIPIDAYWFEDIVKWIGYQDSDLRVVGWLIYPLVLVVLSSIQHYFFKKKEDELEAESKKRRRDWMFRKMG